MFVQPHVRQHPNRSAKVSLDGELLINQRRIGYAYPYFSRGDAPEVDMRRQKISILSYETLAVISQRPSPPLVGCYGQGI